MARIVSCHLTISQIHLFKMASTKLKYFQFKSGKYRFLPFFPVKKWQEPWQESFLNYPLYSSICSQVFSLAQVFHATGGSSDLIPWEIKLKAYFQAAQELRCGRVKGKAVPNRPILDADYVVRSGLILDTYLKDYAGLEEPSLKIIREEDDARKPTFWSNILLHTRCVLGDELFASWEEMRTHKCTKYTKIFISIL